MRIDSGEAAGRFPPPPQSPERGPHVPALSDKSGTDATAELALKEAGGFPAD
jgi:hypothetical protein